MSRSKQRFRSVLTALAVIALLSGCNDKELIGQRNGPTPTPGATTPPNQWSDLFQEAPEGKVDVLWVVDSSGSMSQEQQKLADSFAEFIQFFVTLELDFHLAIVSTDVFDNSERGQFHGGVMTPDTPNLAAQFQAAINVGTSGSGREQGLEAARLALSEPNLSGSNAGFLRDDALLSIIFVSDEEDQSFWDNVDGFNCTGSNEQVDACTPVQDYVDFFQGLKSRLELLHTGAIVGLAPSGCDNAFGRARAALRYAEVVDQFIGGVVESICTETFGPTLQHLGEVISGAVLGQFPVTFLPQDGSVKVYVDTIEIAPGEDSWIYDPVVHLVSFAPGAVPDECSEVIIVYLVSDDTPLTPNLGGSGYDANCTFLQPFGGGSVPDNPEAVALGGAIDGGSCATCAITSGDNTRGAPGVIALGLLMALVALRRRRN